MKTIFHLIETSGPGGAEKMLISLVQGLDKNRYKSMVCLLKEGWLNNQLQEMGFETIIIPQTRTLDIKWIWRVIPLVKSRQIDLLHAHEFAMNTYSSILSALTNKPCITTVHGKNYYFEKWHRRVAYRFVSRQSTMVSVSRNIRDFLVDRIGIKQNRIAIIPNGINTDLYTADNTLRTKIRHEMKINNKEYVIGTIGNLYPVKGQTYLIKAAALVVQQYPGTIFMIAGRGQLLDELQQEVTNLGIEKNVIFLGFREDVAALLQAMDIFVLPSVSEGFPLTVLEAMAAQRPVVATHVGGIPEILVNDQLGLLVPPRDPAALADKILYLIQNPGKAEQLAQAARRHVTKEFSLALMVQRYEALYSHALQ